MNRFTKRLSSRRMLSAVVAAGVLAASAAIVTTTSLAQNRPDRGGGNGFDRRDRGNGNGGYGSDRQGTDRQGSGDRQNFDRSRRFNGNGNGNGGGSYAPPSTSRLPEPAAPSTTTQPASAPASAETAAPPAPPVITVSLKPSDYSRKYVLLEQKNIFSKTRRPLPGPNDRPVGPNAPRPPEESLVLRGIALQEGRRVAFVENVSNNTTSRLTPGTAILSGKIIEVGGDYITYEADAGGHQTRIDIGRNFAGSVATGGFIPPSPGGGGSSFTISGGASASSGAAPPDPNNPNLSVEERMKLRRAQEQKPQ